MLPDMAPTPLFTLLPEFLNSSRVPPEFEMGPSGLEKLEHCLTVLGQDLVFPASERAGRVKWLEHLSVSPHMLAWLLLEKKGPSGLLQASDNVPPDRLPSLAEIQEAQFTHL